MIRKAKKTYVTRAVDFRGIELGKDCEFSNDHEELTKFVTWMKELQESQRCVEHLRMNARMREKI